MKTNLKHEGVVVPMVTPLTDTGQLDEAAANRLVDSLLEARVNGVFVLGTTGEGSGIDPSIRPELIECVVKHVQSRALVYAGIGDRQPDPVVLGNQYLAMGVDAIVVRSPVSMTEMEMASWFGDILLQLNGPVILYNIPMLTKASIPLNLIDQLQSNANLIGIKDSENNRDRLTELLQRFGDRDGFSTFVGVGKLMEEGLRLGANGIVPSVGNLIPEVCQGLWESAQRKDWAAARKYAERMNAVAAVYQANRDLGESLAALKAALSLKGICGRYMSPLLEASESGEIRQVKEDLNRLGLLSAAQRASSVEKGRPQVSTGATHQS